MPLTGAFQIMVFYDSMSLRTWKDKHHNTEKLFLLLFFHSLSLRTRLLYIHTLSSKWNSVIFTYYKYFPLIFRQGSRIIQIVSAFHSANTPHVCLEYSHRLIQIIFTDQVQLYKVEEEQTLPLREIYSTNC